MAQNKHFSEQKMFIWQILHFSFPCKFICMEKSSALLCGLKNFEENSKGTVSFLAVIYIIWNRDVIIIFRHPCAPNTRCKWKAVSCAKPSRTRSSKKQSVFFQSTSKMPALFKNEMVVISPDKKLSLFNLLWSHNSLWELESPKTLKLPYISG